MLKGKKKKSI